MKALGWTEVLIVILFFSGCDDPPSRGNKVLDYVQKAGVEVWAYSPKLIFSTDMLRENSYVFELTASGGEFTLKKDGVLLTDENTSPRELLNIRNILRKAGIENSNELNVVYRMEFREQGMDLFYFVTGKSEDYLLAKYW